MIQTAVLHVPGGHGVKHAGGYYLHLCLNPGIYDDYVHIILKWEKDTKLYFINESCQTFCEKYILFKCFRYLEGVVILENQINYNNFIKMFYLLSLTGPR